MLNDEERVWGLDPTDGRTASPFTALLDSAGTFTYTRRDSSLTGLTYTVWTSSNLQHWTEDTGAVQSPGPPDANDVESVSVTLDPGLMIGPRLFVKVTAVYSNPATRPCRGPNL